jgi:hypothetical protein
VEHGIDVTVQNLASDGALMFVGFSEDSPDTLSSGEAVDGIQIDLLTDYTLHAGGNNIKGINLEIGNGGAGSRRLIW